MRVVAISGPHGVGKTTLVNAVPPLDKPTVKFVDFDVVGIENGYEAQLKRLRLYEKVLQSIDALADTDFVVLLDRSPYDFYPYIDKVVHDKVARRTLFAYADQLVEEYESYSPYTVILVEPMDYVSLNIITRGRSIDDEEALLKSVYDEFYKLDFARRIKGRFSRTRSDAALKIIKKFIFSNIQ